MELVRSLIHVARVIVLTGMVCLLPGLLAQAQEGMDLAAAKGIYRDGATNSTTGRAAVKFDVLLQDRGQWVPVSTRYQFKSGDRFRFRVQTNRDGYIYVLNRTFSGDPSQLASKGIQRVRDEDQRTRPSGPTYRLLYPLNREGNKMRANYWAVLPGEGASASFTMDNQPGVEKLYVVVSSRPLDLNRYFNIEDGELRASAPGRSERAQAGSNGPRRQDSEEDVLSQLNKELAEFSANGESAFTETKGITRDREPESYGVVRDSNKPAQFEVTLVHLPR